jgi:GTP cyclohydrolase IA
MSSNVHALELGRASKRVVGRPDRADVEAAFRTIIRWAGDDPERPGLIETPARVARSFDEEAPANSEKNDGPDCEHD